MCECAVCERIALTKQGKNPYFVRELETGYVVIGDYQRFKGYTLFLCKEHATEIHFLEKEFRNKFLQEMSLVAEAAYKAFQPDKMNYELIGGADGKGKGAHMHWHFYPRKVGDTPIPGPVWQLSASELYQEKYLPSDEELKEMIRVLNEELDKLL
ncbi:MAG: HIT family protein [Lachnospiraceae bacterium]|nr:HIT family protein [Lachnospiraceae bacterium]